MRKFIIVFIILFCASQTGPGWAAAKGETQEFKDLTKAHWAFQSVTDLAKRGILAGFPDQTFQPEKPVTYGEFIKMAAVLLDGQDPGNSPGKAWAKYYYKKLHEKGFYTSFDIPEVKLDWMIPRGDMALVLCGLIPKESISDFDEVSQAIRDVKPGTDNQYEIVKAYKLGLLNGYPDGTFRPEQSLTRAEAASSLERVVKSRGEKSIYGLFPNMEEYRKDDWTETDRYKFVTPEEVNMTLRVPWNGRIAGFDHTMVGFIYLIKDNEIIEYCRSIPAETFITTASHFRLDSFDYIMSIPSKNGSQPSILIVKNPFREQV